MQVLFDEFAEKEYYEAINFYNVQVESLGQKFNKEVKKAIRNIKKYPKIGILEDDSIRKYVLNKFPFKILYSIEENYIYIIAIAHLHRKPNYWTDRK